MQPLIDSSTCSPLPSGGYRGRPLREPCGSPPSRVVWVRKTARLPVAAASGFPWRQITFAAEVIRFWRRPSAATADLVRFCAGGTAPRCAKRQGALLGSREVSVETCHGLGTPATPADLALAVRRDTAFRKANGVGIATSIDFGAESSRPASSLCTLRTRQSPGEWQHSLPARPLRLLPGWTCTS
jgi:hypothetical protein